jgi:hypothetical protein
MRSVRETGDELIIEHRDASTGKVFLGLAIACAAWAIVPALFDRSFTREEQFVGRLAGTCVLALLALVFSESSRFTFDRRRRIATWQRRWAFSTKAGTLPFDQIETVVIETPIGDEGVPSRRAVLQTAGHDIPLSVGYRPDGDGECLALVARIRTFIGRDSDLEVSSDDIIMDSVGSASRAGRTLDAIRLVRQHRGLSLEDAKKLVDSLRGD